MSSSIARVTDEKMLQSAYEIRRNVFIGEQRVPEDLEMDDHDESQHTVHFLAFDETGLPVGTARIRPYAAGVCKVERVAVLKSHRRTGLGRHIMSYLEQTAIDDGYRQAYLNAQIHAAKFYEQIGYVPEGERFFEAGIEHIAMRKQLQRPE